MKQKKLPDFINYPLVGSFFQSKTGRIFSNWVFQGMLYMNPIEVLYKIGLDILLTVGFWFVLIRNFSLTGWVIAWFLAHTVNWIINGQPIAMRRHLDWGENDPHQFIRYIEGLEKRIKRRPYISAAAAFGSLSKGEYRETSDIDIRFVMGDRIINRFRTANYCFWERLRAALCLFPLDLYAFELEEMKRKMDQNEVPTIFTDPHGLLERTYRETVPFLLFRKRFRKKILGEKF